MTIILIVFSGFLMSKAQKIWPRTKTKSMIDEPKVEVSLTQEPVYNNENQPVYNENRSKEELIMQVQVVGQDDFVQEDVIEEPKEVLDNETLIGQLIEQGFNEKYADNLDEAVCLFSKALTLDPKPDLALYLIIDCYWMWSNLGERNYALTQLEVYIKKYLPQFNSDLRHQFDAWMANENLNLNCLN
jgi:hypothetical protein